MVLKSRKLEAERSFPYSEGLKVDANLNMFIGTFPVLGTDLTTEAPGQFVKAAEDKLFSHLENILESEIH